MIESSDNFDEKNQIFCELMQTTAIFEFGAVQKRATVVDLEKMLQNKNFRRNKQVFLIM